MIFFKRKFMYLFERATERQGVRPSIFWLVPHMAVTGQSQDEGIPSWSLTWMARALGILTWNTCAEWLKPLFYNAGLG